MATIKNRDLKKRIIEISYLKGLSHIGSCITAVDIIDKIYSLKKPEEKFILSSGHAGLALYVVLEKYTKKDLLGFGFSKVYADEIFNHHGVHPDRCSECQIDCSSGSLGQGLPIAVGMALANRSKNVYCLISDGESSEGSIYEAFNMIRELKLKNLKVYLNWNGWGAYREIPNPTIPEEFNRYYNLVDTNFNYLPFLKGQDAHYKTLSKEDFKKALEILL